MTKEEPAPGPQQEPETPKPTPPAGTGDEPEPTPGDTKHFKKIRISGSVPKEQWTQLWTSFLVPLKDNGLHITVEFEAQTTSKNPLDENSHVIKCVKESAAQLGMTFEAEE